jgi:hypothetical protein
LTTGPPKPSPKSAVHNTSGPLPGQLLSSPFSGDVLFLFGPRNWGQSAEIAAGAVADNVSVVIKTVVDNLNFMIYSLFN